MITYNELYELLRKERYSEELQSLGKNFLKQVADYFEDKKALISKDSDLFSDIAIKGKKQFENAVSIFKELMTRRRKKVLNLAFVASETGISKRDFENMLDFERELFEEITKSLEKADKDMNQGMSEEKESSKYTLVRFLEDVEAFLGFEGNDIGPFEKGEVANLEKEIVDILSKDNRVEIIED